MSAQVEQMAAQVQDLADATDQVKQLMARFTLDDYAASGPPQLIAG